MLFIIKSIVSHISFCVVFFIVVVYKVSLNIIRIWDFSVKNEYILKFIKSRKAPDNQSIMESVPSI